MRTIVRRLGAACVAMSMAAIACAQTAAPQKTRLFLKDGSYQPVLDYRVVGDRVQYRSSERDGEAEELPVALVDLVATERWQQQHSGTAVSDERAVLSPKLAAEEAARYALTPEVAPNLRLPERDSVLALDSFRGLPELVPMEQQGSDLNRETAHALQPMDLNPAASPHEIARVRGATADVQLHSLQPVIYVRIGDDAELPVAGAMVVETHGNSGRETPSGGTAQSTYVVERMERLVNMRVIDSFRLRQLGTGHAQPDVIEVQQEPLPGGHWTKLTPLQPLEAGEYALVEVLSGRAVNLDVWDFGVNPAAKANMEAIKPTIRKPPALERRQVP